MNIVQVVVYLIVIGVLLYLVNSVVPIVGWMKTVINAVVGLAVLIWLARWAGFPVHL